MNSCDPLIELAELIHPEINRIHRYVTGSKYVALMLENGHIGVCATLGSPINCQPMECTSPDWDRTDHRIWINALLNASINNNCGQIQSGDIFSLHTFSPNRPTIMVGYFAPLIEKFRQQDLPLIIFDRSHQNQDQTPMCEMGDHLGSAATLILTSTSLSNGTFRDIIMQVPPEAELFLLGPSTPLHPHLFGYPSVRRLFGTVFDAWDHKVLDLIEQGHGTKTFGRRGKKVSLDR